MKKNFFAIKIIACVLIIICAIECMLFAILYNGEKIEIKNASDISLSDIDEHTTIYIEDFEILERYAFKTVYEYSDSEGSYSSDTYYVYEATHPMDKNELFAEYFIVKFCDKNNKEYITSLCIDASNEIASSLKNVPLQISACVWTLYPSSATALSSETDKQLIEIRETSLNNYSQQSQIERAPVIFEYQSESAEQYIQDNENDAIVARILVAILGIILLAVAAWLIRVIRRKKSC